MRVLGDYARGGGAAPRLVVAVLHDLGLAARFCDRVLLMDGGAVVADGPPEATLGKSALRAHYRVEPFIAKHDGEPLIVPWRALKS
jgi:iron complex transport system ATP-binding protein